MKIQIVKNAGFCYGVKRAHNMSQKAIEKSNGINVYSLGDLINNKQVIGKLEEKGLKVITNIDNLNESSSLIIRAHGIAKEIQEKIKNKNINFFDATCPYVKIPQKAVEKYNKLGYFIIIVGDKGHPEIIGIQSYAEKNNFVVCKNKDELPIQKIVNAKKIAVVSQTTLSLSILKKIVLELLPLTQELVVINSICDATDIRQKETEELAKKVDLMIIIGGRHSANTTRLYEISLNFTKSYHIETIKDIKNEWFNKDMFVGISAGASTPKNIIDEVYNYIKNLAKLK